MTSKLSRLSAVLRGHPADESAAKSWKMRAEARAARIAELERTIDDLHARVAAAEEKGTQVRRRLDSRRHEAPSPEVLKDVLAVRLIARPSLSYERAAARERDNRWRAASPEYVAALDDSDREFVMRSTVDGVPWWIPLDPRIPKRVERATRQGLPLRAILQTREVAIGGVMLDLGANLGRTSIPRLLLGDVRAVYAAEPHPTNYTCLVRNIVEHGLCGFVVPDRVAIGKDRGQVELRVSHFPGGHRVVRKQRRPVETVTVELWPVDAWIDRVGVEREAVTFVKVDTQGSEVGVLLGAESLLSQRHVAWQLEVDPVLLKRAGTPLRDLLKLIETRFTHFIDIGHHERGPRSRPVREVREALAYLGSDAKRTDLLVYHTVG